MSGGKSKPEMKLSYSACPQRQFTAAVMVSLKFTEVSAAAWTAELPPLMPPATSMADEPAAELLLGGNDGGGAAISKTAAGCLDILDPCCTNAN